MPDAPLEEPAAYPRLTQRLRLPEVSGKWTVFWLLACFLLTGLLIPLVLNLPRWIEFEFVIVVWWVLWSMILTKLLYKGEQVSHDLTQRRASQWWKSNDPAYSPNLSTSSSCSPSSSSSSSDWNPGCYSGGDAEGCLVVLGLLAALLLVWALIEFAIPIVFFMLYFLVRAMLARVVNDKPQCRGHLGLSAFRGMFWATIYSIPLAATIWIIHSIHQKG